MRQRECDIDRHMRAVCETLLGVPNRQLSKPNELRYGRQGSLSVDLQKGVYFDHEAGSGGGVIDLIRRQTGCHTRDAFDWLKDELGVDLAPNDDISQIVATYDYVDENDALLFQAVRHSPKRFNQRRPDKLQPGGWAWSIKGVRQVPYRLPELMEAIAIGRQVFIVEGEKDVERLRRVGVIATCNAMGAGKWRAEFANYFRGANVVVLPDNDAAGKNHAEAVATSLIGAVASVRVVCLPGLSKGGDISDWLATGGTIEALNALVEEEPEWRERPPPVPSGFVLFDDIDIDSSTEWLVRDMVPTAGLSVLYGEPGGGKSFLALDLAMHVATGRHWFDRAVNQRGVVYVAAEGQGGFRKRVVGFRQEYKVPAGAPLALLPESVDMHASPADADRIAAASKIIAERWNAPIGLIVLDTMARVIGGGDENNAADMGCVISNASKIAEETNAHVLIVHHKPKDGSRTPRGHSSLLGAVEAAFEIEASGDGVRTMTVAKQKDGNGFQRLAFTLSQVSVGHDEEGEQITTCVVTPTDQPEDGAGAYGWTPSGASLIAVNALDEAIAADGQLSPGGACPEGVQTVSVELWKAYSANRGISSSDNPESRRRAFDRAHQKLLEKGVIGHWNGLVWRIGR